MDRPARDLETISPDLIRRATDELAGLVRERLPERFYPSEPPWRPVLTGLVARMVGIAESMALIADSRRQAEALVLLRSLYEHLVVFLWIAIEPETRAVEWVEHSLVHRRVLHRDAADNFGVEGVLTDDQLVWAESAQKIKPLLQRAEEVDAFWGPRIRGFYENPPEGPRHLLTLRGMYMALYRLASRDAHATVESVDRVVYPERGERVVVRCEAMEAGLVWSAIAIPLLAMALVVAYERLGWPDADKVREINDGLTRQDADEAA